MNASPTTKGRLMKTKAVIALLGLAAFTLPAAAQNAFYAGGSIGQATARDFCNGLSGPGVSCDDQDTAWKIYGGYQFHPNVAVELGYADLGEAKASGGGAQFSDKATAFDLTGVGSWSFASQLSVFGRFGFYRSDVKSDASLAGFGSASDSK